MATHSQAIERETHWREVLSRHATSNLSIRAFCKQEQIHESSFFAWRRTIHERDGKTTAPATTRIAVPSPAFVPALVTATPIAAPIEIKFPNRCIVRLDASTPATRIAELVRALEPAR